MRTARLLLARCCCLDRCSGLGRCLLLILPLVLATRSKAQVAQSKDIIRFRLRDGYLILVQARINGAGPFDFLLDMGATRTVIDPELARQLQVPVVGEVSLTGILHVRQDALVRLEDVRLGEASQSGLGAAVDTLTRQKVLAPGIRGVLGEDFLSKFDILIDYKRHWLRFGDAPPAGERCRFETIGRYRGSLTTNRLLIPVEFMEVSRSKVQLQLDTGARVPELIPANHNSLSSQPWSGSMATSNGANGTTVYSSVTIKIGTTMVRRMDVVQSRRAIAFDAAGLLPAAIFRRIYISHSGGFVVLNPPD
jgi:aspartyl protease